MQIEWDVAGMQVVLCSRPQASGVPLPAALGIQVVPQALIFLGAAAYRDEFSRPRQSASGP